MSLLIGCERREHHQYWNGKRLRSQILKNKNKGQLVGIWVLKKRVSTSTFSILFCLVASASLDLNLETNRKTFFTWLPNNFTFFALVTILTHFSLHLTYHWFLLRIPMFKTKREDIYAIWSKRVNFLLVCYTWCNL